MVKLEKNDAIREKIYLSDYIVHSLNYCPIIVITHDKCMFSTNNSIWKAWTQKKNTFLQFKGWGQGIIISKFFFLFGWFNLFSLTLEKRKQIKEEIRLVETKTVEIFEYGKNNDRY